MRRWWILALFGGAVFPVGCGHDERSLADEREPRTVAEAYCGYLERCFPQVLQSFSGGGYEGCMEEQLCRQARTGLPAINDPEECMKMLTRECSWSLSPPLGRGSLGPVELEFPFQSACSEVPWWVGEPERRIDVGDSCLTRFAEQLCGPNSYCRSESHREPIGNSLCGTCVEALADGEPCGREFGDCRYGSKCHDGICTPADKIVDTCEVETDCASQDTCREGRCEPKTSNTSGEKLWEPCDSVEDCGLDLSLACYGGQCVPRRREGADCDPSALLYPQCQYGLFCKPKIESESSDRAHSGTCVKPACVAGACQDEICGADEVCTLGGRCVAPATEGESCDGRVCGEGLLCDWEGTVLCVAQGDLGAECRNDWECKSSTCDRTTDCAALNAGGSCADQDVGVCASRPSPDDCRDG